MIHLLICLGLCTLACDGGGSPSQPAATPGAAKAKGEAKAEAAEAGEPATGLGGESADGSDYSYNPIGKRDPFRSFISGPRDEEIRSPTPLQRFEIDQYALVGIVWGIDHPRAMVSDPENVGHVIEIGTYIGKNWGKVTQITSNEVIVTEEYQTIDGELVTNQVTMALPVEEFGDL